MAARIDLSRRDFLKTSALSAAGLVIAFTVPGVKRLAMAQDQAASLPPPNAFLRIGNDDSVTVLLSHSEMGQGIWTALPMLIAEELDADWNTIRVEHSPASPVYAHTAFGLQMTGGSSSTWSEFDRYRQVGAMARNLLARAAAAKFGVAPDEVHMADGVASAGNNGARYGELADAAAALPQPSSVILKDPEDWKLIGKATKRLDSPEKTTGRATFGMDVKLDGLLTAVVLRAPAFGGTVRSFDAAAAKKVAGVRDVVQVPSGIAVVADHYWAAKTGRDALKVDWDLSAASHASSDELLAQFRELAGTPGAVANTAGDVGQGLADAAQTVSAEYAVPYLAHSAMEPLNCTVRLGTDRCEIWTGTQFQGLDRKIAAEIAGLTPEQVNIHTMFLGGGFGRRANPVSDFVAEAVHVAKASGKTVKVVWSREDDTRGGYYRPMYLHTAQVGLDDDGMPVAWKHSLVGQSIMTGTLMESMMVKNGVDATSVEGVADSPYLADIGHRHVDLHSPNTGVPVLWWRSVGHSHNAFVMESLVDELANAAGKDPLEYRRELLARHPRHLGVLNLAAKHANRGSKLPAGHSLGIAVHESFGSFVAQVAEVSVDNKAIRVHRVVCAVDCGIAVNPETIRAQMESAIAFGLSAALYSELTVQDGKVQQSNFHDYRVLRLNEMPVVDVHIVPSQEKPGGIGEPGTPPIAPAVANAVFAATGKRLRRLPMTLT